MNLGVDIRCLQDKWRTGVGEYVWQTLKELGQGNGLSISGFANAAGRIDLPPELDKVVSIKRGHLPNKIMNLRLWLRWGRTIDSLLSYPNKKLDVFWLPNPGFAFVSHDLPTVLTVHDLSFLHYPHFFPNKGKLWYFPAVRRLLKSGLPARTLIAAVSQHTAEDLKQKFPSLQKKVRSVPPGLNSKYFKTLKQDEIGLVKEKYKLPDKYILSLGTIEPRKNYSLLLEMYQKLLNGQPDFPYDLVIAGSWGWRYHQLLKQLAQMPQAKRVKFTGYVSDEDKAALYAGAELFLFPSLYEGIGLPPLEAMASGVPVISSHNSSLPEVVGQAGVLLSPYLVDTWVEAVAWLIKDAKAREQLRAKGLAQAKLFSWTKTAQAYQQIFNDLISGS